MDLDVQEECMPTFYVGQHESKRQLPVSNSYLEQANNCNYDMLTTPITNDHFHSRVLQLLSLFDGGPAENGRAYTGSKAVPTIPPLSYLDTPLMPEGVTSQLLAMTSTWIDLCSPDPLVAGISRQVLLMEIAYAAFCGIEYVFIEGPRLYHGGAATHGTAQYARAIHECLSVAGHMLFHIVLPMIDHPDNDDDEPLDHLARFCRDEYLDNAEELRPKSADLFGTWDAWNSVRANVCYHAIPGHGRMELADMFSSSNPKTSSANFNSVKMVFRAGHPVLTKQTQTFISRMMRLKMSPWILLCDVGPIPGANDPDEIISMADGYLSPEKSADAPSEPTPAEAAELKRKSTLKNNKDDPLRFLSYIRHLQRTQPSRSEVEKYGSGYQDYLQVPLQPLTDNLESMTYEVFEKDPVKYDLYEVAVRRALRDWADEKKPTSSSDRRVVVAVAGAGRGPLVTRALRASETERVPIELWALEKNPNAFVLLQRHNNDPEKWNSRVNLVQSDMRSWKGPWRANAGRVQGAEPSPGHTHIDILISELLGSFADNELSPECLDGILHLLAPKHGISIPRSYTAYLTPIAAPKLYADISSRTTWDPTASETPAVVWLHAIDYLSIDPSTSSAIPGTWSATQLPSPSAAASPVVLPAWSFNHGPQAEQPHLVISNEHNKRYSRLPFRTRHRGVCHGLAGYFESVLYPGVELSTNPNTADAKSKDMISWFPIFFPLKTPIQVPDNASLTCTLWRQTDDRKVWYEWMVESWMWGPDQRRIKLGQSDLHSSLKNGCLM